jgi:hypothetical protein
MVMRLSPHGPESTDFLGTQIMIRTRLSKQSRYVSRLLCLGERGRDVDLSAREPNNQTTPNPLRRACCRIMTLTSGHKRDDLI